MGKTSPRRSLRNTLSGHNGGPLGPPSITRYDKRGHTVAIDREKAYHLLQHTALGMSEISCRLGQPDSNALRKLITDETGLLPKEYRARCRRRGDEIQRTPVFEADPREIAIGVGETTLCLFDDLPAEQIGQTLTRFSLKVGEDNDEITVLFRGEEEDVIPNTSVHYRIDVKRAKVHFFNPLYKTYSIALRRFFNEFIPATRRVSKRLNDLNLDDVFGYKKQRYQVIDIGEIVVTTRRLYQRGVRNNTSNEQVKDRLLVLKNIDTGKDFVINLSPSSKKKNDPSTTVVFQTNSNVFLIRKPQQCPP